MGEKKIVSKVESSVRCPFCGRKEVFITSEITVLSFDNPGYKIQAHCLYCGAAGPSCSVGMTSKDVETTLALKEWERSRMYLYKEHNDGDAYGNEIVLVFNSKNDAINHLKKQVRKNYSIPDDVTFEEIPEKCIELDDDDTFTDEYVSIYGPKGISFYVVEEAKFGNEEEN